MTHVSQEIPVHRTFGDAVSIRRFGISIAILFAAALLGMPGVALATPGERSDVSHITFVDPFEMKGCSGKDSILQFSFQSTGTGTVTVKAVANRAASESEEVASINVPVTQDTTEVRLPIHNDFVGYATVSVEAANYAVQPGQKGDQTARNETNASIGIVNCAAEAPLPNALMQKSEEPKSEPSKWPLVIFVVIAVAVILALCRKARVI